MYKACKAERLYSVTHRMTAPNILLHFMFKKANTLCSLLRDSVEQEYVARNIAYYAKLAQNHEAKWDYYSSELRMEFNMDMLQTFLAPSQNMK